MEENIKKDYLVGKTYKEICEKHSIKPNQLKYLIRKHDWKRKSNRSKAQKGNQNAKGNSGGSAPQGNKNAVTTGEFENIFDTVLNKKEQKILKSNPQGTKETILQELKLLTVREIRMLDRVNKLKDKNHDMTITRISKGNEGVTSTEVQNTLFLINKIEDGLTRVQESKRRHLDLLYKIECDKGSIVEKPNEVEFKKNTQLLESISRQLRNRGVEDGK